MGRHSVDFLQFCIKRQKRENVARMERTTTPPQYPQQPQRAIVHRGWLQQKTYKNGTLLRKKKIFYENELFVVLSLHNGYVPRLEWFVEQSAIFERRPLKSQDLTECQFVNLAIGDERCFAIGFVDGSAPVLELLAPSIDERAQWVDILRTTLRQLNLLSNENTEQQRKENANEYVVLAGTATNDDKPSTSSPTQQSLPRTKATSNGREKVTQSPRVPLTPIPPIHFRTLLTEEAVEQNTNERKRTQRRTENSLDESMPLVRHHSTQQMQSQLNGETEETRQIVDRTRGCENEERCPHLLSPDSFTEQKAENGDSGDSVHSLAPPPLPPRTPRQNMAQCSTSGSVPETVPPLLKSPIPMSPSLSLSHYEMLTAPSSPPLRSHYDQLPPSNRQSQCSDVIGPVFEVSSDQHSTPMAHYDVLCASSAQYEVINVPSSPPLSTQQNFTSTTTERIFRDALSRTRRLFFSFTLLTEHIAFVELFDKVWVAGWTSSVDLRMRENGFTLNFGDEVERIDGSEVRSLQALTEIYQRIMPGAQIPILLRSNPTMMVFTLVKPENPQQNLGIKFNRVSKFLLRQPFDCLTIDSICPKTPAQNANLPATVPAYLHQPAPHSYAKAQQPKPFHVSSPSSPNLLPSGGSDRAVITHLDGVPLNPFGPRDQFYRRLDSVLVGHSFNIILHSADFCSRLARQMKNQLGNKWRHFVHGE